MKRVAALFAVTAAMAGVVPATAGAASASSDNCNVKLLAWRIC
jgi:hypothetical protein